MRVAYVDTSCLVAVAFAEPGHEEVAGRLSDCDRLVSSNLLEAELRSAFRRESVDEEEADALLSGITWVHPDRRLTPEFERVLSRGYARGADLWHLACCLFLGKDLGSLEFVTLDNRQRELARDLGLDG